MRAPRCLLQRLQFFRWQWRALQVIKLFESGALLAPPLPTIISKITSLAHQLQKKDWPSNSIARVYGSTWWESMLNYIQLHLIQLRRLNPNMTSNAHPALDTLACKSFCVHVGKGVQIRIRQLS